ncbi:MAG: DUF1015 domain-containing protein [Spirochaetales bacterium]|nr:DUF1015 domain-containing protein [Spirochaetales bacterium]
MEKNIINQVKPFKALHYNPEKISNIGDCLTQPYDVISPEAQEKYYEKSPYNFIRLILGKIMEEDDEKSNRYTRAKAVLEEWRSQNILKLTDSTCFWIYEQEFSLPGEGLRKVKGFIGRVKLHDYDEMKILRHEKVLKGPLQDRIDLTKSTNCQFEYIWGVYQDKEFTIDQVLEKCTEKEPLIDYLEKPFMVRHKLWKLSDQKLCRIVEERMEALKIYIADGHHRYATMLQISEDYRKANPHASCDAPWEYILMFLVNSEHEGLTVLPTHRMLHSLNIENWEPVIKKLEKYFSIIKIAYGNNREAAQQEWLTSLCEGSPSTFGLALKNHPHFYALKLKDYEAYDKLLKSSHSKDWKMLEVNVVNYLVLQEALGISEEQLAQNTNVKYVIDEKEGLNQVYSGAMEALVVLNRTSFQDVINVSNRKEMMPRKSTYFYPKPVSGLAMYPMDSQE